MNEKCFRSPIDSVNPTWGNRTRSLVRLIGVWAFPAVLLAHSMLFAQAIPIGTIDYYGLRTISEGAVSQVLGIAVGDTLPSSTTAIVERLEGVQGVVQARVQSVCCVEGI